MTGFGDTIVGRPHFHSGIVVHESVEPLRPHHERRDDLPSVQLLARSGHHAALDQVQSGAVARPAVDIEEFEVFCGLEQQRRSIATAAGCES